MALEPRNISELDNALALNDAHFLPVRQDYARKVTLATHKQYIGADLELTGNALAPTKAAGNNTTAVATTAFVMAAIAALVNGAPGALDQLNELSAALGNDPAFATTIINALALKANRDSDTLTGVPRSVTPPDGDASTRIATTAYVQANSGGIIAAYYGNPGYVIFKGGLQICWGQGVAIHDGYTTFTYPIAFKSFASFIGSGSANSPDAQDNQPSSVASTITYGQVFSATGGNVPCWWIAVGDANI